MVILNGQVYIGGGYAEKEVDRRTVIVYGPQEDCCSTLPPYTYQSFSMAVVSNQLVVVGGEDLKMGMTNKLGVWNEELKSWAQDHPLPPMTIACSRPTVVTRNNRWLVVIGGAGDGGVLSRVEILDTSLKQWYHSTPMPQTLACKYTLAATIDGMCYLVGGYTSLRAIGVCLDDLVSQALSQSANASAPLSASPWLTLPSTRLIHSSPLAFSGSLMAFGGTGVKSAKDIHVYNPISKKWVKAGEMLAERSHCSCILLPNGDIMVTGGVISNPVSQQIHLATIIYTNIMYQ